MKRSEENQPEHYQVLARRFRPQQFDQIIGQGALVTTLENSLRLGRVGHAYLFCGPRGVGKTTVARILAKALNCEKGPTTSPCDKCQNCQEITQGNALDVLEIDGASNRGIDEIRNLRENVKYMAASSRTKIYIIDEVHMLTQEAFNALLKTLEEPPSHVKFFFATTDPQKLPATILSRCQKFELKRIPAQLMTQRLQALAKQEKVSLSQDACLAVIQQAQGSMRDAESLLEVLIASGSKQIDFATVQEMLGLSDQESLFAATDAITGPDGKAALKLVSEIFSQGREPGRFLAGFVGHLRNLLVTKILGDKNDVLEMPAEQIQKLSAQAAGIPDENLVALLDLATRSEQQMRNASHPRILLELFFMKAVEYSQRPAWTGLLARLEQLESRLKGTPVAPAPDPPESRPMSLYEDASNPGASDPTTENIRSIWAQIAQSLATTNPIIRTCMQDVRSLALTQDDLVVQFGRASQFHKKTLEDKGHKQLIEQELKERLGRSIRIKVDFLQEETVAAKQPAPMPQPLKQPIDSDPALRDALSILKGKIVRTSASERKM